MAEFPIVAVRTFIEAIRDTGYKSTSAAVAELVDNSIDADASAVDINLSEAVAPEGGRDIVLRVSDDGCGMSAEVMQLALQFGGSTRFNSRAGSGRFGMGLPCSSLSQARRVEVVSWESRNSVLWTYLDVDEITLGALGSVPAAVAANGKADRLPASRSGTVVSLSKCDRLQYRRISTLQSKLRSDLGQTFRRSLEQGVTIRVNDAAVDPVDPLFLHAAGSFSGAKPYGPPLEFSVRVPGTGRTSVIRLVFSELPVQEWGGLPNEEKTSRGIAKGAGVSVLRHGREIDYGWYFMGGKRRENYDDWWRCQVEFEPVLDELFGVMHSKQRINPTEPLNRLLVPHVEPIARELNSRVRRAFLKIRAATPENKTARRAEAVNSLLEPPAPAGRRGAPPKSAAGRRINGLRYRIAWEEVEDPAFFVPSLSAGKMDLTINKLHPFFGRLCAPLAEAGSSRNRSGKEMLELMLLAFGRAECSLRGAPQRALARTLRERWSAALTAFLE